MLAEKTLARAAAAGEPTTYMLTAQIHLHRYRAESLVANGRAATADLAAGDAAVEKLLAIDHGAADTRLLRKLLRSVERVRPRRTSLLVAMPRPAHAPSSRLRWHANRFLEREAKPLIAEAETLAR